MGSIPRCEKASAALKSRHYLRFSAGVGSVATHTEATEYLHAALPLASVAHGVSAAIGRCFADPRPATAAV
jgi:hypothetical protein